MTHAFTRREAAIGLALGLSLAFFFRDDIGAIALPTTATDLEDAVTLANLHLPEDQVDGSVLEHVERSGTRIVYHQTAPDPFSTKEAFAQLATQRCATWRAHLRSGAIEQVETRYQGSGVNSVYYQDWKQCR